MNWNNLINYAFIAIFACVLCAAYSYKPNPMEYMILALLIVMYVDRKDKIE